MGHVPKTDEYLKNGIISSGVHVVLVHMFFLLGHGITKRNVDIVDDFPGIISSAATILRLWDDLGSAQVILRTLVFVPLQQMIISCFSRYTNELGSRLYYLNYCDISILFLGHKKYMGILPFRVARLV